MKKLITKEAVKVAYDNLKAQGKAPTAAALHVALGSRGSLTTITKLRDEIERERGGVREEGESPEFLTLARNLWGVAHQAGVSKYEPKVAELTEAVAAADRANEELQVEAEAREQRIQDLEAAREQTLADLTAARDEAVTARAASADNANRLISVQDTHAREIATLRQRLEEATTLAGSHQGRVHALELELATLSAQHRSVTQLLETTEKRLQGAEAEREHARADAAQARSTANEAQANATRQADRLASAQEQYARELKAAQAQIAELQKEVRSTDKLLATKEAQLTHVRVELENIRKPSK